ncbi:MAG TPA: spermidine/putrescine ABC transporter substrate-binding protein [Solirubrobacteraceae bacterium]|jgi:spermidine/putrescine transport system substrate-binding protein|nr:spermidine/putrescine ABC transporter substrate-binding protein [Solirubrobacteraceae bacterium]
MSAPLTRKQFLGRAATGGAALTVPGFLSACGTSVNNAGKAATTQHVTKKLAKTLNFDNWPLYIDVSKSHKHPSLEQFTKQYGVQVNYVENINDNQSFFGKIQGPLSRGEGIGADLIVMTDSSGYPQKLIQLGWLEKLYKPAIPNIKNLVPSQQNPSWDPNRDYSLPWQSGMTGIGYDPNKVGYELTSVEKLLSDPKLKGKITLLNELSDTVGLIMLANGDDPAKVTKTTWNRAMNTIQKAVNSGQIRQFTGNDYAPLLANGSIWACFAWSGDLVQLKADHPGLKWTLPDTGGMLWTDNMLIPLKGDVYTASTYMNFYYTPKVAAEVEDYVNYVCPVQGADQVLVKQDPAVAKDPLIFPTKAMYAKTHPFDPVAVNNQAYKQQFQNVIGA